MQKQKQYLPTGNKSGNNHLFYQCGFSLIELLVMLGVFSILMMVVAQVLLSSLKSVRKTEASVRVRQNVEYALSVIERHLHSAKGVEVCNLGMTSINYLTANNVSASFSCITAASLGYVSSSSASLTSRLTSEEINVTSCKFDCVDDPTDSTPPLVTVTLTASDRNTQGAESAQITQSIKVYLRSY